MRRVVGADHADDTPLEAADQRLPVCRASDGWKHLHGASHMVEVLRGQEEELGARLDAEEVPTFTASSAACKPRALDRCAMCRCAPDSRATVAAAETATASASGGLDSRRSS